MLVARNLDWAWDELPVVTKVTPDTGRKYLQVGFSWNAGVFTGMNDVHGPLEWVSLQDMALATAVCVRLAELWARE